MKSKPNTYRLKHIFTCFLSMFFLNIAFAQQIQMSSLDQLINKTDPAWPEVKQSILNAKNQVFMVIRVYDKTWVTRIRGFR